MTAYKVRAPRGQRSGGRRSCGRRPEVLDRRFAALPALFVTWLLAGCSAPVEEPASSGLVQPTVEQRWEVFDGLGLTLLPHADELRHPSAEGRITSLSTRGASFDEVLLALFADSDVNLVVDGEVGGSASLDVKDATLAEAFEVVLSHFDLASHWDGSFVRVGARARRVFDVDYPKDPGEGSDSTDVGSAEGSGGSSAQGGATGGSRVKDFWEGIEADLKILTGDDAEALLVINDDLGTVLVECRPSTLARVEEYLETVQRRATRQVSIEAHVFEVKLRHEYRTGVDFSLLPDLFNLDVDKWAGITSDGSLVQQAARAGADTFQTGFLKTDSFSLFVDALEMQGQVRVISSPRISTLHNVPAVIRVVEQVPVIDRQVVDTLNGTRTEYGVRFEDAGVVVAVTPFVGEDGVITAEIRPAITEVSGYVTTPDGLVTQPILNTRTVHTVLRVPDGQPIVLGGLRGTSSSEDLQKTPWLGDIPLLGALFRQTVQTKNDTELIIVLFPRILTPVWEMEDLRRGLDRVMAARIPYSPSSIPMVEDDSRWSNPLLGDPLASPGSGAPAIDGMAVERDRTVGSAGGLNREDLAALALRRALVLFEKGQGTQGRSELDTALDLQPDLAAGWILQGLIELRRGRRDAARRSLERALVADPDHPVARNNLALLELHEGNARAAEALLEAATANSMSPALLNNLGLAMMRQNRPEEAATTFGLASRRGPQLPEPHLNLAACLMRMGREDDARLAWFEFLKVGGRVADPRLRDLLPALREFDKPTVVVAR